MNGSGAAARGHGWRFGSLAGIPLYLARSWPIIGILIVVVFGPVLSRAGRGPAYGYLVAAGYAVLILGSVLVHEAAHALVARARGHRVDRIVADVWGGHTVYDARESSPGSTALIAVVGPLSNIALGLVAWGAQSFVSNDTALMLLTILAWANMLVGVFNLLPGLPLDGGQIVSALVWKVTGQRTTGMVAAGWLGRLVAIGTVLWFIGRPLLAGGSGSLSRFIWPAAIAFFLWTGASQAIRAGQIQAATAMPADVVIEPAVLVPATATLADLPGLVGGSGPTYVVAADSTGWPFALFNPVAADAVPHEARGTTVVSSVVTRMADDWVLELGPEATLTDVVAQMGDRGLSRALVIDPVSRRARGLITAERVNTVVGEALHRRSRGTGS